MPNAKLKEFLDENNIKYICIQHSSAYTAQETAQSAHIPGRGMAKTVMVKIDGKMAMAVLPASEKIDLDLLKSATGAGDVSISTEKEFKDLFPNCETGAMPPFGNLYDMDVYVEEGLGENEEIAFNAGTHTELMKLSYKDFENLVKPNVVRLSAGYVS